MKQKQEYKEGQNAKENFERAMIVLFKAPKPQKHKPNKRKKGKD